MFNKTAGNILVLLIITITAMNANASLPTKNVEIYKDVKQKLFSALEKASNDDEKIEILFVIAGNASRYDWGEYEDAEYAFNEIIENYSNEEYALSTAYLFSAYLYKYIIEDYRVAIDRFENFKMAYDPNAYKYYGGFSGITPSNLLNDIHWKEQIDKEISQLKDQEKTLRIELEKLKNIENPLKDLMVGNAYKKAKLFGHAISSYNEVIGDNRSDKELIASALVNIGDIYSDGYIKIMSESYFANYLFVYTGNEYVTGKTKLLKKGIASYEAVISGYKNTSSYSKALLGSGNALMKVGIGYKVDISRGAGMEKIVEKIGDYKEAIKKFIEYVDNIKNGEDLPYAKYNIGLCYKEIGEINKAKNAWSLIINEYPDHEVAKMAKNELLLLEGKD